MPDAMSTAINVWIPCRLTLLSIPNLACITFQRSKKQNEATWDDQGREPDDAEPYRAWGPPPNGDQERDPPERE